MRWTTSNERRLSKEEEKGERYKEERSREQFIQSPTGVGLDWPRIGSAVPVTAVLPLLSTVPNPKKSDRIEHFVRAPGRKPHSPTDLNFTRSQYSDAPSLLPVAPLTGPEHRRTDNLYLTWQPMDHTFLHPNPPSANYYPTRLTLHYIYTFPCNDYMFERKRTSFFCL